ALLGVEHLFAQAQGFGSDLDVLVIGDVFDGLLEAELFVRDQANRLVGGGGAHVGLLLFLGDVDVHVGFAGVVADDHAFVNFNARADEELASLLQVPQREGGADAGTVGDERSGGARGHFAAVIGPAGEDGVNDGGAAHVGEQLAAQTDQAARGDVELHAD